MLTKQELETTTLNQIAILERTPCFNMKTTRCENFWCKFKFFQFNQNRQIDWISVSNSYNLQKFELLKNKSLKKLPKTDCYHFTSQWLSYLLTLYPECGQTGIARLGETFSDLDTCIKWKCFRYCALNSDRQWQGYF